MRQVHVRWGGCVGPKCWQYWYFPPYLNESPPLPVSRPCSRTKQLLAAFHSPPLHPRERKSLIIITNFSGANIHDLVAERMWSSDTDSQMPNILIFTYDNREFLKMALLMWPLLVNISHRPPPPHQKKCLSLYTLESSTVDTIVCWSTLCPLYSWIPRVVPLWCWW